MATMVFGKTFQPCNVISQSSCNCSMPKFKDKKEKSVRQKRCDPDLIHNPYQDHTETKITEVWE